MALTGNRACPILQSLLLRMPGINSSNVKFLMNRVESLYELSTLSLDRLKVCAPVHVAASHRNMDTVYCLLA